jgi:hypothetical protein
MNNLVLSMDSSISSARDSKSKVILGWPEDSNQGFHEFAMNCS